MKNIITLIFLFVSVNVFSQDNKLDSLSSMQILDSLHSKGNKKDALKWFKKQFKGTLTKPEIIDDTVTYYEPEGIYMITTDFVYFQCEWSEYYPLFLREISESHSESREAEFDNGETRFFDSKIQITKSEEMVFVYYWFEDQYNKIDYFYIDE